MFDRASLKLGLDKAVLQSMLHRDNAQQLSRKEVEDLLRRGAYGAIMDEDNEGQKFGEEDIDTILQRRTQTIKLEPGVKGSTFARATFTASNNIDIDLDDPNFWSNWAKKANIDVELSKDVTNRNLIISEPRTRRKRYNENYNRGSESGEEGDGIADGNYHYFLLLLIFKVKGKGNTSNARTAEPSKGRGVKKRRRGGKSFDEDDDYVGTVVPTPDELAFTKTEYFKATYYTAI